MMDVYDNIVRLADQSPHARIEAVGHLSKAGEMAVGPLLSMLLDQSQPPHARACAAKALGNIRSLKAESGLIAALQDPDMVVRCPAAMALGKLGSPRAALPLSRALSDESFFVRKFAADSLIGVIRECRTPEKLMQVLGAIAGSIPDEPSWHPGSRGAMARLVREIEAYPAKLMARSAEGCREAQAKAGSRPSKGRMAGRLV
jgi:HEAT repeat protein